MANMISVAGNLGKAAELRQTQTGKVVLSFAVADNQIGKTSSGEPLPPLWWNCQRAAKLHPFLLKGTKVTVFGRASSHTYQDKDGSPRFSLDINVHDVTLQDSRSQSLSGQGRQGACEPSQQSYGDVKGNGMKQQPQRPPDEAWRAGEAPAFDDFIDDDIPL